MATLHEQIISGLFDRDGGRIMWSNLLKQLEVRSVCEIGVFRGALAERVLRENPHIEDYTLIDPWRWLPDWNKPSNKEDATFSEMFQECQTRLASFSHVTRFLRGTTKEVIAQVADGSLDALFIDGDHTLRGITLDLGLAYSKVKPGGVIGIDDFTRNIWQHGVDFDPTLVHPYAVCFAELKDVPCYAMPNGQLWIVKNDTLGFRFHDRFGYSDLTPQQIFLRPVWRREDS